MMKIDKNVVLNHLLKFKEFYLDCLLVYILYINTYFNIYIYRYIFTKRLNGLISFCEDILVFKCEFISKYVITNIHFTDN